MQPTTKMQCTDETILETLYSTFSNFGLLTAHKMRLFGLLGTAGLTTSEIASALGISERPAGILLTMLTAQGFLFTEGNRYFLQPIAQRYFVASSPTYLGGMLDFAIATHPVCTVENLETCMRSNKPLAYGRGDLFQTHEEELARARFFTQAMHSQSMAPALAWPKKVDLEGNRVMLDIAGGSGAHSIGALQSWPGLKSIVFEIENVCALVREYSAKFNLSDRITPVSGNMWIDNYPPADVHFYSLVYHDWPLEKCQFLTEKSFRSLPFGGKIIVHEILLDTDKSGPLLAALMSMVMLLWTEGRQYSGAELARLLENTGFIDVRVEKTLGPWGIVMGRKP
jgi:O-methyltransferase domain